MVKQIITSIKRAYTSVKTSVKTITNPLNTFDTKIKKTIPDYFKTVTQEQIKPKIGITYLLTSPSQPFQIKCGETTQFENRIKTLSGTSVSEKFQPIAAIETTDWKKIEKEMHEKFSKYRINKKREFFGFSINLNISGNDFEELKTKYAKLQKRMVKKLHKYADKYYGKIIV
jgi:hypothetical protein